MKVRRTRGLSCGGNEDWFGLNWLEGGWTVGRCSLLSACSKTGLLYRNLALFYEKPPKSRLARGL